MRSEDQLGVLLFMVPVLLFVLLVSWAVMVLGPRKYPLIRRDAAHRIFHDEGLYCTTNSFAQLVDTPVAIEDIKKMSDNWSWFQGRLGLVGIAMMMLWNSERLRVGVSLKRMYFGWFCTPQQICNVKGGVLLVCTAAGHCYGLDAHARTLTDPETKTQWKHMRYDSPAALACILGMQPDDFSACYLQVW